MKIIFIKGEYAKKIAGKLDKFHVVDPVFIGTIDSEDWYCLGYNLIEILEEKYYQIYDVDTDKNELIDLFKNKDNIDPITRKENWNIKDDDSEIPLTINK